MRHAATLLVFCTLPIAIAAQAPARPSPTATPGTAAAPQKPATPAPPKTPQVVTPGLAESAAPPEITNLVKAWLEAWNKLDGSEAATQKFVDLYTPDARHEVGAPGRPLGPEYFAAPQGIRRMAEDFVKANTEAAYRLETFTADEKGADLIYYTEGPWGGPAVAVPYTGAFTVKETKRRFFYPGVVVFHIKDGKIAYARFYQDRDDLAEVRP
jgi:ketosteroid isomerase-like protein